MESFKNFEKLLASTRMITALVNIPAGQDTMVLLRHD